MGCGSSRDADAGDKQTASALERDHHVADPYATNSNHAVSEKKHSAHAASSSQATSSRPGSSRPPSAQYSHGSGHTKRTVSSTSQQTAARPAAATYDSKSAASLSTDKGAVPYAFYGLLSANTEEKLSLKDKSGISSCADDRTIVTAVHPCDDSTAQTEESPDTATEPQAAVQSYACRHSQPQLCVFRGVAMTLPYTILVAGVNESETPRINAIISNVFASVNATLNAWNPESDISQLNETPPAKQREISSHLASVFDVIDCLHGVTEGRFDPTAGVLNLAWSRMIRDRGAPPLPEDVRHLKYCVGWSRKVKRKTSTSAARMNANAVIDIDGIAKGFTVDLLVGALFEHAGSIGISAPSFYVDWSGDIRTVGKHPSGRPWRCAVMQPPDLKELYKRWSVGTLHTCLDDAEVTHLVSLQRESGKGLAIATSGDYFHLQKFGFHHIVNPENLSVMKAGASSVASVSVLASSCAMADGLATAAMTFESVEESAKFLDRMIRKLPNEVLGYSVLSRFHGTQPKVMTSPFFASSTSEVPAGRSNSKTKRFESLTKDEIDIIHGRCPRLPCMISWQSLKSATQVDSFVSLSMRGEKPCASFIVSASMCHDKELERSEGILSFTVGTSEHAAGVEAATLTLRPLRILRIDQNASMVIASVTAASQGTNRTLDVTYGLRSVSHPLTRWDEPSVFSSLPLKEQTKIVLRRVPSPVWVVTTGSVDGAVHGLTASSVAISSLAPNVLTFNVMETNVFHAALCGVGAIVKAYALSTAQNHFAVKFVETSDVSPGDVDGLTRGALLCLEAVVELTESFEDHMIIIGRIQSAKTFSRDDKNTSPLIWLDRKYESLTATSCSLMTL